MLRAIPHSNNLLNIFKELLCRRAMKNDKHNKSFCTTLFLNHLPFPLVHVIFSSHEVKKLAENGYRPKGSLLNCKSYVAVISLVDVMIKHIGVFPLIFKQYKKVNFSFGGRISMTFMPFLRFSKCFRLYLFKSLLS